MQAKARIAKVDHPVVGVVVGMIMVNRVFLAAVGAEVDLQIISLVTV